MYHFEISFIFDRKIVKAHYIYKIKTLIPRTKVSDIFIDLVKCKLFTKNILQTCNVYTTNELLTCIVVKIAQNTNDFCWGNLDLEIEVFKYLISIFFSQEKKKNFSMSLLGCGFHW